MADAGGGSGSWCPDCGTVLVAGQSTCHVCGLDYRSAVARDVERANGEIHRLRSELDSLTGQYDKWLAYRTGVLADAPRTLSDGATIATPARLDEEAAESAGASTAPNNSQASPFPSVFTPSVFTPIVFTPTATPHSSATHSSATPASATPASARRPAKTLSAPVLLGVAGAALIILAGIVFVAASWLTYGPGVRMSILVAFAATFAWLAITATKHEFPAVGGALGVVSAAFVGVSVYALTAGPSGSAPFTLTWCTLVAGLAGLGLARLRIKGVGAAASGAVVFAVEAAAIEAGLRAVTGTAGFAFYVFIASTGGGLIILTRAMWTDKIQRDIAKYGGVGIVLGGAAVAVVSPLAAQRPDAFPIAALFASALACLGVTAWRPRWGAAVLTALLTLGTGAAASMWTPHAGHLVFAGAFATGVVTVALGWAPVSWRRDGLKGLVPGSVLMGIALAPGLLVGGVMALAAPRDWATRDVGGLVIGGLGSVGWFGAALIIMAAIPFVTKRWTPPELADRAWSMEAAASAFCAGSIAVGIEAASLAADGPSAGGVGLVLAGAAWWFAAPRFSGAIRRFMRGAAIIVAVVGGLHGAIIVSLGSLGTPGLWWGSIAAALALVGLAAVALTRPVAASGWVLVGIAATAGWTWRASGLHEYVVVAIVLAALVFATVAVRLPHGYAAPVLAGCTPAFFVGGVGLVNGATVAFVSTFSTHPTSALTLPWWVPVVAAAAALATPSVAELAARFTVASARRATTRAMASAAFIALALSALAYAQQVLANAPGVAPMVVDSISPLLAVGACGIAFAAVRVVPWWRPSRWPVGIAMVALVFVHGVLALGRLAFDERAVDTRAFDTVDPRWAVPSVIAASIAFGIASRWVPRVTLAPAVFLASCTASATLAPYNAQQALAAAVVATALVAWSARWSSSRLRPLVAIGGVGVAAAAAFAVLLVLRASLAALIGVYGNGRVAWHLVPIIVILVASLALLAWTPAQRAAGAVVAAALIVAAGFVPAPLAWVSLAVIGLLAVEAAARWRTLLGLHPFVPLAVVMAAFVWSGASDIATAITLGALSAASVFTAVRAGDSRVRSAALALAPLAGAISIGVGLGAAGVSPHLAATVAAGTALAMPLVAASAGLDKERHLATSLVAIASVAGPIATQDLAHAGTVVLIACAAWFTLSTLGTRWARWIALGGLSVAAALFALSVGIATVEAYAAIPAITMIGVGVWWLKRDPAMRTYYALAPGLGVALVPTYVAVLAHPNALARPLALVGGALLLAIVGVALKWFAPLLATAVTTVVVFVSQLTVDDALTPRWVSVAVIGAVLFALALLAERIKAMR